jgi:hypothetical protein
VYLSCFHNSAAERASISVDQRETRILLATFSYLPQSEMVTIAKLIEAGRRNPY